MRQTSNCCPHCSADIKPLGQDGICWHCRRPLKSNTTSDASANGAGSLTGSNLENTGPASAQVAHEALSALWQGIGWAVLLPILFLFVLRNSWLGYTFGVIQWVWIVPMMRKARNEGRPLFARGLKSGAWFVFIPYALVFGLLDGAWILVYIDLTPGKPWFY